VPRTKLFSIRRQTPLGAPPGTLISPAEAEPSVVDVFSYSEKDILEHKDADVEMVRALHEQPGVAWVNLTGLGNADLLVKIAEIFGLHHLALEDVLNVHQRPKIEEFDDYLFVVTRMISGTGSTATEQVSIFLGEDYVLSVQEQNGDCFDAVRNRLRRGKGLIRGRGADYLCYALIDSVVDAYFPTLENLGEDLEQLEDAVVRKAEPKLISALHEMKRDLLALRRAIWPHREMLNSLVREEHVLLARDTQLYLRDCYDHTIQLMDIVETYREIASGLMDVYISSVSTKLNEIMKVLTIIATVFMPLGFIASLYGMNFDRSASAWNMPELGWKFGYLFSLGIMSLCAIGLIAYFWKKGWLSANGPLDRNKKD
jgi:magnesium transporter